MDTFHLVIFDQTGSPQCCLGPWWSWQGNVAQLRSAANQLISGPNPGSLRIFTAASGKRVALPLLHDLNWGEALEGERELDSKETEEWLLNHGSIQLFLYNGDSDCIRHLLALPLAQAAPWFPRETR